MTNEQKQLLKLMEEAFEMAHEQDSKTEDVIHLLQAKISHMVQQKI